MSETASHATLLGVGSDNNLYTRDGVDDGSQWQKSDKGVGVIAITVMPDGTIVGVRPDHDLYTMTSLSSDWSKLDNSGDSVPGDDVKFKQVTALDDGSLIGIDTSNRLWRRRTLHSLWEHAPESWKEQAWLSIAIAKDGNVYGVGTNGNLYTRQGLSTYVKMMDWQFAGPAYNSFLDVCGLPNGKILLQNTAKRTMTILDSLNDNSYSWFNVNVYPDNIGPYNYGGSNICGKYSSYLYYQSYNSLTSGWSYNAVFNNFTSQFTPRDGGNLAVHYNDHHLYQYLNGNWEQIPNSGNVVWITQLPDRTILAIGVDHELYTRDTPTGNWTHVPSNLSIIGWGRMTNGTILGIGADHRLYAARDVELPDSWGLVAGVNDLTGVTSLADETLVVLSKDGDIYRQVTDERTLEKQWASVSHAAPSNQVNIVDITPLRQVRPTEPIAGHRAQFTHPTLTFDGMDDYIDTGEPVVKGMTAFTLEGWVKPASVSGNIGFFGADGFVEVGIYGGNLRAQFDNNSYINVSYPGQVNEWHHIAVTRDGNQVALYVDGERKSNTNVSSPGSRPSASQFKIGGEVWSSDALEGFSGQMTEIRIWNRAYSQMHIQGNMNKRVSGHPSELIAYWPLDKGSGNIALDQSGKGHSGTIYGATWKEREGHLGLPRRIAVAPPPADNREPAAVSTSQNGQTAQTAPPSTGPTPSTVQPSATQTGQLVFTPGEIKAESLDWSTVPKLPPGITGWLVVVDPHTKKLYLADPQSIAGQSSSGAQI